MTVVTPTDLRAALLDLALAASCFVRGADRRQARINLGAALGRANAMRAATLDPAPAPVDPEALIVSYINQGGDWQALTAAISRHALRGATRQAS